ncbi:MAG: hypothetical protein QXR69_03025 [Conexivisphaerales archaeon]
MLTQKRKRHASKDEKYARCKFSGRETDSGFSHTACGQKDKKTDASYADTVFSPYRFYIPCSTYTVDGFRMQDMIIEASRSSDLDEIACLAIYEGDSCRNTLWKG